MEQRRAVNRKAQRKFRVFLLETNRDAKCSNELVLHCTGAKTTAVRHSKELHGADSNVGLSSISTAADGQRKQPIPGADAQRWNFDSIPQSNGSGGPVLHQNENSPSISPSNFVASPHSGQHADASSLLEFDWPFQSSLDLAPELGSETNNSLLPHGTNQIVDQAFFPSHKIAAEQFGEQAVQTNKSPQGENFVRLIKI